jgi:hypothetical protein
MSTKHRHRGLPSPQTPLVRTNVYYRSGRARTLRGVTLIAWLPVPLTAWLLSRPVPATQGWDTSPLGPKLWWMIPLLLLTLTLVLPAAMFLLHDRYVLAMERQDDGRWQVTTWLLWGQKTREFTSDALAGATLVDEAGTFQSVWTVSVHAPYLRVRLSSGKRLIFDAQGEVPNGWPALEGVFAGR